MGFKAIQREELLELPHRPSCEAAIFHVPRSDSNSLRPNKNACAQFLAIPEVDAFVWGGCGQRELKDPHSPFFCCERVERQEVDSDNFLKFERRLKAERNQTISCPSNESVYTYMHRLNVNRLVPLREGDNSPYYLHSWSYERTQERERKTIADVINEDDFRREPLSLDEIGAQDIAEIEIGFMNVWGSLEISCERDQQQ